MLDRIHGKSFFDPPINSNYKTYENVRRIATVRGDDYTTGCLLDFSYFKEYHKMIAIHLSKKQVLDTDPRAIQQISIINNNVLYYWKSKGNCFGLFTRNC